MRVPLVEDDRPLSTAILRHPRDEGSVVGVAEDGEDGQHPGETERLDRLKHVPDGDAEVGSNSVTVIVARLRREIGPDLVGTVRGRRDSLSAEPA